MKRSGFVSSMVERSTIISSEYGLNAILNSRMDDYFYKTAPSNGFKVKYFIFNNKFSLSDYTNVYNLGVTFFVP